MAGMIHESLRKLVLALRKPTLPSACPAPLRTYVPAAIDFNGFTKGIDNVHIDVRLSPKFQAQTAKMIGSLLEQETGSTRWGGKGAPTRQQWEDFRLAYARMLEAAIHRAKAGGGLPLIQLVQVATIKFLVARVQTELDQLRQGIRGAMGSGGSANDSQRLELTEQLSWLARNRAKLRYKVLRQLFAPLIKTEEGSGAELRHSLLGQRWSLPLEMMANPLLQAEEAFDEEVLMKEYVFLEQGQAQDADGTYSYAAVDRVLPNVFRPPKPATEQEAKLAKAEQAHRLASEHLAAVKKKQARQKKGAKSDALTAKLAEAEARFAKASAELDAQRSVYLKEAYAWAEDPGNVETLFNIKASQERLREAKKAKDGKKAAEIKALIQYQHRLLAVAERYFRRTPLLGSVLAAYEMVPCLKDYAGALTASEVHAFLADGRTRKAVLAKIKEKRVKGKTFTPDALNQALGRLNALSWAQEGDYLCRFLKDFLTLRRDIANLRLMQEAMGRIELQEDPKNVRLSRANRTLYEFYGTGEEGTVAQTVRNHVILKADIRGSTTMVAELRKRGLNPASHFSLNFFEPLNEVLETYGANKVFIEGDAVILSLLEHEEALEHQLSVARMCGIGKRLLLMVQAQNAACRKDGLPELELGIGIVYSEEPPTFLYDGKNEIMISSAIGKADRLSSCSWMLRKERAKLGWTSTNVDIYEIPEGDPLRGEKGEVHLRYNLNGLELDEDAFFKLQSELTMQEVEIVLPGDDTPTSFYAGRYPDLKGALHRVVVRQGRMRLFDLKHPRFGVPTSDVFYEVVTNEEVLRLVAEALKTTESQAG